jgi:Ca-activated chloride channel family protein
MKINQNSFIYTLIILFFSHYGFSQKDVKLLRHGNKLYDQGKYKEAEVDYRKALEINKESDKGKFNLGTAVYQEKNFNEATKIFEDLSGKQLDKSTKAKIFHNYGNSLLESKQYEQSNPADKDTKYNLEYARSMLKKQQQQQQQQDKNQDKKDQDKKDQNNKDKEQQNKDQNKNQSQDQNKKISKDDAERMLEALKNHEKKTMAKLKKSKANIQPTVIEKDW